MNLTPRQLCRQRPALGLALLVGVLVLIGTLVDAEAQLLHLLIEFCQVCVQRLVEQALLLGRQGAGKALAGGGELQPLEHRHLVGELVDQRLLEADLAVFRFQLAQQCEHCLPRLRVYGFELLRTDHGG